MMGRIGYLAALASGHHDRPLLQPPRRLFPPAWPSWNWPGRGHAPIPTLADGRREASPDPRRCPLLGQPTRDQARRRWWPRGQRLPRPLRERQLPPDQFPQRARCRSQPWPLPPSSARRTVRPPALRHERTGLSRRAGEGRPASTRRLTASPPARPRAAAKQWVTAERRMTRRTLSSGAGLRQAPACQALARQALARQAQACRIQAHQPRACHAWPPAEHWRPDPVSPRVTRQMSLLGDLAWRPARRVEAPT